MIRRCYICDACKRSALRPFRSGGEVLCPNCALREASDRIRDGLSVSLKPLFGQQRAKPVVALAPVLAHRQQAASTTHAGGTPRPGSEAGERRRRRARPVFVRQADRSEDASNS